MRTAVTRAALVSLWVLGVSACGSDVDDGAFTAPPPAANSYTVGGTVTGLNDGATLVLQNNGGNNLSLTANGAFTFSNAVMSGTAYNVTVATQPTGQTCAISNGSGTIGSANVTNVVVSCTPQVGKFLYVPNAGSNNVSTYSVDASTGALTEIAGSPFAADRSPSLATADPAGQILYVINQGSPSTPPRISSYAIGANGALTQNLQSPVPVSVPPPPNGAALFNKPIVHRSGQFLYVTNVDNGILYGASADATGILTQLPDTPRRIGDSVGFGEFDAAGSFLYVPHDSVGFTAGAGGVAIFQVNPLSGVLTSLGEVATNASRPTMATLTPSGKFLLVAHASSTPASGPGRVAVFAVDTAGMLTAVAGSPFATGGVTTFVVAHPTKNFVYANSAMAPGNVSSIVAFQIDPNSGVLTPIAGSPFATGGNNASVIRIDASGRFLYVANRDSSSIAGFAIDQTTGALAAVPGSPTITDAAPLVTIDPSGRYLYSTNSGTGANTIASYAIHPTTGTPTLVNKLATGITPVAVEIVGRQ